MHQKPQSNQLHLPVLLEDVLRVLKPKAGGSYLDLTAGYGGHAAAIVERTGNPKRAVLVDRDPSAIAQLQQRFKGSSMQLRHQDFLTASVELAGQGMQFDTILADLGVSSPHLNVANRGFAISQTGPLDMRMDQTQELTAATVVNTYSEGELEQLLREYGEEPHAKKIAHLIVSNRPIATTTELAALVASAWPGRSKVHPATRTFQALRIAVNDELRLLELSLPLWIDMLSSGGRLAVISFHSLEDRLVKRAFLEAGGNRYDATVRIITKQPITASPDEIVFNPRARSAKLRAVVKK